MTRLLIHVEGQTEETFVNSTLAPHLYAFGYTKVSARLLGNSRNRAKRGGITDWHVVKRDIERHLRQDTNAYATIMVDYYALPHTWPGRASHAGSTIAEKAAELQCEILHDFEGTTGISQRFVPFVLMHEFEALLFSDCSRFAHAIGHTDKAASLQAIRDAFADPEHINDSPQTAPSKRIIGLIPAYDKVLFGNVAVARVEQWLRNAR